MERLIYRWRRFWWTSSSLERGVLIGGSMLAIIAAVVAVVTLARTGADQPKAPASVPQGPAPQVEVNEPMPSATALAPTVPPTATPQPVVVAPSPTPKPPSNRKDCDEIRGTAYLSSAEREWFLANCAEPVLVESAPAEPAEPPSQPEPPASDPAEPPPAPSPTPSTAFSSAEAISLAAAWMESATSLSYDVNQGACTASQTGSHWVVSCPATIRGCQGSACQTTIWVCVLEETLLVLPSESC